MMFKITPKVREERLEELPEELVRQASEIAKKVVNSLMAL